MSRRITLSSDIVVRLQARDPSAYDELLREAFPALVRFAYRFAGSVDVAEDVVQSVFVRIYLQGEDFTPQASIEAYLFTAVRNGVLSRARHEKIVQDYQERAMVLSSPDGQHGTDTAAETADMHRVIDQVLSSLTEHQQTAFDLRYRRQLTIPEIAQVLDISTKAAERLISRVTHTLRTALRKIL